MVLTILGLLLVWFSSIPCEKTSTQNFLLILFYGVTLVVKDIMLATILFINKIISS
jgi:hypothetical protein